MGSCCSCCSKEEAKDPYIRYDKPETNDFTNEKYDEEFKKSIDKREEFWAEQAKKISWEKEPTVILEGGGPDTTAKWFTDGELNIVYNCLDRHVDAELGDEMMFLYSSPQSKITAKLDYDQVCANTGKIANVLKNHFGLAPGDHVFFYAPTIPMVLCVLLSCARMGAVHDACYGGVSPEQLAARLDVSKPKLIMVVSGAFEPVPDDEKTEERPFDIVKYVPNLEKALDLCKNVDRSVPKLIYQRRELGGALQDDTVDPAAYTDYKDVCEDDELDEDDCDFLPSTHPLYVAYTSGASGLPVGIVRDHGSTAVALQYAMEHVFGMTRESVQFAACHQAWSIGLDFMVYGPLLIGCKTVIWEGDALYPDPFILWTIIESNGVTNMIVNISTLREIRKEDYEGLGLEESDLSCLKSIALVGERSDPEIVEWLHEHLPEVIINDTYFISELCWPISGQLCQLDTYETVFPTLKGSVTRSIPGFDVKVLTDDGTEMEQEPAKEGAPTSTQTQIGHICLKRPLPPGCYSDLWVDLQRDNANAKYWKYKDYFYTGDMGYVDENGYLTVVGREEDVIELSDGRKLYPKELEDSILERKEIAECVVVAFDSKERGRVPIAFVVMRGCPADEVEQQLEKPQSEIDEERKQAQRECRKNVNSDCGEEARLVGCIFIEDLPKTRSGQLMRKAVRDIVSGAQLNAVEQFPYVATQGVLEKLEAKFKEWEEPTDESELSAKGDKNRGCC